LQSNHEIIGSWAGDRIVVAGDYADEGKFIDDPTINLYDYAHEHYNDVSDAVITAMCDEEILKEALKEKPFRKELIPDIVFQ
jgi:hypothetical protein